MCLLASLTALQHDEVRSPPGFLGREGHWAGEALPIPLGARFAVPVIAGEEQDAGAQWPFSGEALCKTDASDGKETLDSNSP